ncbi:MAG: AI-2E family transporter [Bacteroidota bacterium]
MKSYDDNLKKTAYGLIIVTIIVLALTFLSNIIMPILFSGLASIIFLPIVKFWRRRGLNNGLSVLFTVLLITLVILGGLLVIIIQSQEIVEEMPQLIQANKDFLNVKSFDISSEAIADYINEHSETIQENLQSLKGGIVTFLEGGFNGLKNTFIFLITCPIYIFFMLLYRDNVYRFVLAFHGKKNERNDSKAIINEVKNQLYHYLKGLVLVMLVVGTLTGLGLFFLGIEYALFLGILTALLTPIPYIGVVVSATIPVILALLTKDSIWYPVGVLGIFVIVQFAEGNFITPRIMGNSVNINPLIILLSIVVLGSISGLIGLILTVPILAVIKVIVDHYPQLKHWSYLLEDKKSY